MFFICDFVFGFQWSLSKPHRTGLPLSRLTTQSHTSLGEESESDRREFLNSLGSTWAFLSGLHLLPQATIAAVGALPEFQESNAIIQGITVNVADKSQQDAMINFLVNGFDFKVLRKRIANAVEDTVRTSQVQGPQIGVQSNRFGLNLCD